jgi:hypothetical protein
MTQEEISQYNSRCAEFLGAIYSEHAEAWGFGNAKNIGSKMFHGVMYHNVIEAQRFEKELIFHSDWNWIMEVVEAIEKKTEHFILGIPLYNSFDIGNRSIKFYYSPNNQYLLQLELKQMLSDEPWIHTMYKHHIIQEFDFKTKGKKEAVVEAINQFLIWYNKNK